MADQSGKAMDVAKAPPAAEGGAAGAGVAVTTSKWSAVLGSMYRAAADGWLDLPPQQESLAFLRLSAVLLRLSSLIYDVDESHVGQRIGLDVPLAGPDGDRAPISATLVEFRAAVQGEGLSSPEQFGIWTVEGVGICVAFRGTASAEDVLVDVNIRPTPLQTSRSMRGVPPLQVHQGFYNGVKRHLPAVQELVAKHAGAASDKLLRAGSGATASQERGSGRQRKPPVWVTGHSLGGGYANCVVLHMLANRSCAELFGGGGGAVTFGAPMVLYGEDSGKLYAALAKLEAAASDAAGRAGSSPLHFHNFVCGSDAVPRLLGASLESVHDAVADYWKIFGRLTTGMRQTSQAYRPFGTYSFILGKEVRTPRHGASAAASSVGDAEYAARIAGQLDVNSAVRAILRGAASSPAHDHFLASYEAGLRATMEALAAKSQPAAEESADDPASMFRLLPPQCAENAGSGATAAAAAAASDEHIDALGRTVGKAGWSVAAAAAGFAGRTAYQYMQQPSTKARSDDDLAANSRKQAAAGGSSSWGGWFGK